MCRNDKCSFSKRTTMFITEQNVLQVKFCFRTTFSNSVANTWLHLALTRGARHAVAGSALWPTRWARRLHVKCAFKPFLEMQPSQPPWERPAQPSPAQPRQAPSTTSCASCSRSAADQRPPKRHLTAPRLAPPCFAPRRVYIDGC